MADLQLMLRLDALDKATRPLRNLQGAINDTSKSAAAQRKHLLELQSTLNNAPASRAQFEQMQKIRKEMDLTTASIARQEQQIKLWARTRDARSSGKQMMMNGSMKVMGAMGAGYVANSFLAEGEQFDVIMSRVQALARLDKGSETLKALRDQSKHLGATTWASPTQVAEGQAFYAMAGFTPDKIMNAMPATLDLARAGQLEIGRAADIGSNILSAFKLPADEMGRVADSLVATFTRTNTDMEMLGQTMKYVAPVAQGLGMSLEESLAMTGLLGNIGIQGDQAGTSLRKIEQRLSAPPSAAAKALKELGIKAKDDKGNLRNVASIFQELFEATKKMGSADKMKYLTAISGLEASAAMTEFTSSDFYKNYATLLKDIEKAHTSNEAKNVAKTMADNLAGDKEELKSAYDDWRIAIYEVNDLGMRDLTQNLTKLMTLVSNFTKSNPELISNLSKITGSAIALTAAIGGITMAAGLLKFAFVGHPIITALTLAVFLGMQLYDNFDAIMELWNSSPTFRWIASLTAIGSGLALIVAFAMKFKVLLASAAFAKSATLFMTMANGMKALNFAFLASPVFWALALMAGLIYMVYKNWDSLVWFWNEGAAQMQKDWGDLLAKIPGVGGALKLVWDVMSNGLGVIKDVSSWIVELITNTDSALLKLEELTRALTPELYKPKTNAEEITQYVNKQPEIANRELVHLYNNRILYNPDNPLSTVQPINKGIESFFTAEEFVALAKAGRYDEVDAKIKQYQQTIHQTNTIIINGAGDPKAVGDRVADTLKQHKINAELKDAH